MHDILIVDVLKRLNQTSHEKFALLFAEFLVHVLLKPQLLMEIAPSHEVHDKIKVALLLQRVVQLDDKVALNALHKIQLVHEIADS